MALLLGGQMSGSKIVYLLKTAPGPKCWYAESLIFLDFKKGWPPQLTQMQPIGLLCVVRGIARC